MTKSTPSSCSAKDRSTCRYHGDLEPAISDMHVALEEYDDSTKAFAGSKTQTAEEAAFVLKQQKKFENACAAYDALPAPYKELKKKLELAKNAQNLNLTIRLEDRLRRAEAVRSVNANVKRATRKNAVKPTLIQRFNETAEGKKLAAEPQWKKDYRQKTAQLLVENGKFTGDNWAVEGIPETRIFGGYVATAKSYTDHMKTCEPHHVTDTWGDTEASVENGYYGDETHVEHSFAGAVTCNCGVVMKASVIFSGNQTDLYSGTEYEL